MIIGSSHGVGGGPTQTEVLSTVVAQLEPIHATCMEEVNKNIDQIIQYMEIGARGFPGYDLFVSPEFGVQGMHPLERLKVVLTLDSPEVGRLKEACARLKVWGIFGVILKLEGHEAPGNCAIMINDEGEVVHQYCKMNPWIPTERHYPGWECPVTPGAKGSRIATIVCADGDYPEIWREAAYNGANVVVRITHYMNPWEEPWKLTNRCAAYCNQVYVVGANCYGMEHACAAFGNSMIVNPDGNIVTEAPMMAPICSRPTCTPAWWINCTKAAPPIPSCTRSVTAAPHAKSWAATARPATSTRPILSEVMKNDHGTNALHAYPALYGAGHAGY